MKDRIETNGQQNESMSDEEFYEAFLAEKKWPEEYLTEEDHLLDEKFRAELEEEVKREEELQSRHPELEGEGPSPDLFDRILAEAKKRKAEKETEESEETGKTETTGNPKGTEEPETSEESEYRPEEYLSEDDRKALEIGRKRLKRKKYHGWISHFAANAAILVCVFLVGVSTEANRTKIVNVINTLVGNESLVRVNNETDREKVYNEQEKAYAAIEDELGIKSARFMYEVRGMDFAGYEIDENVRNAALFYKYQGTVISILMSKDERGNAQGAIKDGDKGEQFEVQSDIGNITVQEIDGNMGVKYAIEFIYNNTYYYIMCELPKKELINWLGSIFF